MVNWEDAAYFCHTTFGTKVNYEKGLFVCPECGHLVKASDWVSMEMGECPHCGVLFEDM